MTWIVCIGFALLMIGALYWMARAAGKKDERLDNYEDEVKCRKRDDEIREKYRTADLDSAIKWMRKKVRKPAGVSRSDD